MTATVVGVATVAAVAVVVVVLGVEDVVLVVDDELLEEEELDEEEPPAPVDPAATQVLDVGVTPTVSVAPADKASCSTDDELLHSKFAVTLSTL